MNGYANAETSLREGSAPHGIGNQAIEKLIGIDKLYTVRIIVQGDDKIGSSLVDGEITGSRTMNSYGSDVTESRPLLGTDGDRVRNIHIAPLKSY